MKQEIIYSDFKNELEILNMIITLISINKVFQVTFNDDIEELICTIDTNKILLTPLRNSTFITIMNPEKPIINDDDIIYYKEYYKNNSNKPKGFYLSQVINIKTTE